eukprot:COSAG01_NODE_2924_length_6842_cov_3.862821_6_plen_62_part_00
MLSRHRTEGVVWGSPARRCCFAVSPVGTTPHIRTGVVVDGALLVISQQPSRARTARPDPTR